MGRAARGSAGLGDPLWRGSMHADLSEVKKSVRSYMIVFGSLMFLTIVTVAIAEFQLATPLAITLALVVATVKASLVAAVFMHLNHEKMWIYGSLVLTAAFFLVLMLVPMLTNADHIGTHSAPTEQSHTTGH
jgi:caa(3)-type oxidase subunit IV